MDMSEEDQDQVEILVHISAPSRGTDDAAYRAFARAYLAFEPTRRFETEGELLDEHEHLLPRNRENRPRPSLTGIEHEQTNSPSTSDVQRLLSFREAADSDIRVLSALKSPDASFKSVLDNMDSPEFYRLAHDQPVEIGNTSPQNPLVGTDGEYSWQTVSDSRPPMTTSSSAVNLPTKVLQRNMDLQASPSPSALNSSLPFGADVAGNIIPTSSIPAPLRNSAEEPPSSLVLPALPRKRQRVDEPEGNQVKSADLQTPVPTPIILPFSSNPIISSTDSRERSSEFCAPLPKRQRQSESAQNRTGAQLKSVEGKKSTVPIAVVPEKSLPASRLNPDEIHPLLPKSSLSPMTLADLITPELAQVESGLHKSWHEEFVTRDLRDTERGYWLINFSTWDSGLRNRSWEFLKAYLGHGLAGWGVWCARFPETSELRIYCWGRIVKHIYLLLHMVGERKVKRTGATWFDGDGIAVVTVPPK